MTATEDLFTPIHKGLRAMLYDLSTRLQTNDFADLGTTEALVVDLERDFAAARTAGCVLCVMSRHAEDEERAVFPPALRAGNGLVGALVAEHHDLSRQEIGLGEDARALLALPSAPERIAAAVRLNQRANALLAAYLAHMNREELELVPLLQRQFTDAELAAMRGAIIAATPRDRLFAILDWMLPALNVTELTSLLASVGRSAPPPMMQAIAELAGRRVDPARWAETQRRLATAAG